MTVPQFQSLVGACLADVVDLSSLADLQYLSYAIHALPVWALPDPDPHETASHHLAEIGQVAPETLQDVEFNLDSRIE